MSATTMRQQPDYTRSMLQRLVLVVIVLIEQARRAKDVNT